MILALGSLLTKEDSDIFHSQVAPRCRQLFEERFLDPMTFEEEAVVVHLGCRTGFHDEEFAARAGASSLVGVDTSPEAIALASSGASTASGNFAYHVLNGHTQLPDSSFSHAVSFYSLVSLGDWSDLAQEGLRLLKPGGQFLMALPLRGSYNELFDLLRESPSVSENTALAGALHSLISRRPNVEQVSELLEDMGFADVDVSMHRVTLEYATGPQLVEDPLYSLLVEPQLAAWIPRDAQAALEYVRLALSRYWFDLPFELSLSLGYINAIR